jgi:flagellar hook-basal body complex protein FliE
MAPITLPPVLRPSETLDPSRALPGAAAPQGGASFADALSDALGKADQLQLEADRNAQEVALGGGNLHETALSMAKADVAMRLAVKVRNKIVDAYQDIMRMSV